MPWCVYILHSEKLQRFYTGCTSNFHERLRKHSTSFYGNQNFTSKADDWELFLLIECKSELQAKAVERHIKKMKSKIYKRNLKKYPEMIDRLLRKYSSDC